MSIYSDLVEASISDDLEIEQEVEEQNPKVTIDNLTELLAVKFFSLTNVPIDDVIRRRKLFDSNYVFSYSPHSFTELLDWHFGYCD